jgi:hypothetical protein
MVVETSDNVKNIYSKIKLPGTNVSTWSNKMCTTNTQVYTYEYYYQQ